MTQPETPGLTAPQLALLRRLVGDTAEPYRHTDLELAVAAAAAPPCQPPPDRDGRWPAPSPDLYEVAARLWEDRALLEQAAGTATETVRVTDERNGDVAVKYAGPGKMVGAAEMTPDRMLAMARQLRRRSCNRGARTVVVRTANGRLEQPRNGTDLYPSQIVNVG